MTITTAVSGTVTVTGSGNATSGSGLTVIMSGAAASAIITGSNDTVMGTAGSQVTVAGQGENIAMSGGTLSVGAGGSANVPGSGNVVTAGTGVTIGLTGNANALTGTAGDVVTVNGANSQISMLNATLTASGGSSVWLTGDSDTANALTSNTTVAVVGNTDTVNGSTGDMVWINSQSTTVNMDGGLVYALTGSNIAINGSNDTITLGTNVSITITGNNNTVWADVGDVFAMSGVGNIIHGVGTTLITSQNISLTTAGFISSAAQTGHDAALNGLISVGATSSGNQQDASLLGATAACMKAGGLALGAASMASIVHGSASGWLIGSATLGGCIGGVGGYLGRTVDNGTPINNPVGGGGQSSLFADNRTVVDSIPPGPTYV